MLKLLQLVLPLENEFTDRFLKVKTLAEGFTHSWTLDLSAGDVITLTVAPAESTSIFLSLFNGNGVPIVSDQNLAPAGEVETIEGFNITDPGEYELLVRSDHGTPTDYALMYMDADSYNFVFRGQLLDDVPRIESLPADTDHFWFFTAESSQSVSFTITPNDDVDTYIELYGPNGSRMLTIDDTGEGEVEVLDTYTLLDGGMYGIRVAEFGFRQMQYQIVLIKP